MNNSVLRTTLVFVALSAGFVLLDAAVDHLFQDEATIGPRHIAFAAVFVLFSYVLMKRGMDSHERAMIVLRQARDEMDLRVKERTAELECANTALQAEIAGRRHMEDAVRQSEERYRTLFDHFPEPMTVWDQNGILRMQNLVSARNLGGKREDFLGKTIFDIFGEPASSYMERMTRVIVTGTPESQEDTADVLSEAHHFWTWMQRVLGPDGQDAVQVISYDITDRKRAEEALRASEEKFAKIFQLSPDAIGIVRAADGTFLDVNHAFTRLLEYDRAEIVGKAWSELNFVQSAEEYGKIVALFRQNGEVTSHELSFPTRTGHDVTILLSLITLAVGGEPCILAIAHDITAHKQAEEALSRVQAELAKGTQERTALQERQRLARELHDSVSQALYGVSLGIHTALTLFDSDRNKVLEALNYALSLAKAGITEMRTLIFELRPESLEMEGLVIALTKQVVAIRARHGIDVNLDLCREPEVPLAVKEVLYRIAQEAMQNAVKHAHCTHLDVRLIHGADDLQLEVNDNGIGFDPEHSYPGHLGLRSMRERAVQAGGILDIISAPAGGAHIRACIPISLKQGA